MESEKIIQIIVVLYSREIEAKPFIEAINAKKIVDVLNPRLPMIHHKGSIQDTVVHVVIFGKDKDFGVDIIGKLGASMACQEVINKLKPDLIINAGTASAFEFPDAKINDVYLGVENFYIIDRRTSMAGYSEYITGKVPCIKATKFQKDLDIGGAIIASTDSMDLVEEDLKMARNQKAQLLDMEAATIAWVARQFEVPVLVLKGVSHHVHGSTKQQIIEFRQHLLEVSSVLASKVLDVVEYVNGKTVRQLE